MRRILRTLGIHTEDENVTEEDIKTVVKEGHEQGLLEAEEAVMINNVIELGETEARDIMTHRRHIRALGMDTPLKKAVDIILSERNSRFPVYGEDIDDVRGVLYLRDAVICREGGQHDNEPIGQIPGLLRDAHFTPETRSVRLLLQEMQRDKQHLTLAVDEYGQTAGIVAMEDILEEIVGNIFDEYDEEETVIVSQGDGSYLMSGMASFEQVRQILDISQEEGEFETLNGFLISLIGKIPAEHEKFELEFQGWEFRVESVRDKMIHTVKVAKAPEKETPEQTEDGSQKLA